MKFTGFTLIRNGHKYDYPFRESIASLHELCGDIYIAFGDSEDETENTIRALPFAKITATTWDENLRRGGEILSQQTNIALENLRSEIDSGWAFYLQGDEVISEQDFALIKKDIILADSTGCDAVSFRYFHFWHRYDQIAIKKNWYPQEIRAIKVKSSIISYGDAQSFKNATKVYQSNAHIYHYGHVREEEKYQLKRKDFNRWWHADEKLTQVEQKANKKDKGQETLRYFGLHPKYMGHLIKMAEALPAKAASVTIIEGAHSLSQEFVAAIYCDKVRIIKKGEKSIQLGDGPILNLGTNKIAHLMTSIFSKSTVPFKMRSKLARDWPSETYAMLRLSQLGIGLRKD